MVNDLPGGGTNAAPAPGSALLCMMALLWAGALVYVVVQQLARVGEAFVVRCDGRIFEDLAVQHIIFLS